jgi:signal transduction histidine kinase
MRFRGKTIRRKIVALLLVPLVALTVIWSYAVYLTGRDALQLVHAETAIENVGGPLAGSLQEIQKERSLTLRYLVDPGASDVLTHLRKQRAVTDTRLTELRHNARRDDTRSALGPGAEQRLQSVLDSFAGLGSLRSSSADHRVTRREAYDQYNWLCDQVLDFQVILPGLQNSGLDQQARALIGVDRAREALSREEALLGSALTAGRLDRRDLRDISELVTARKVYYTDSLPALPRRDREAFHSYWSGPATIPVRTAEDAAVRTAVTKPAGSTTIAGSVSRWSTDTGRTLNHLDTIGTGVRKELRSRVKPAACTMMAKDGVAALLGLGGLLMSVMVSVRIGRGLIRDLSQLRKEAHKVSGVRLPSVMRRLAAGEQVDVETEAPRLEYGKDEVGQIGQALNSLQCAAVEAAVRQADLRRGVSGVFVNLARRNQVLLHRQLTLLDTMERRTEDTEELADLFRLDHLTARMRRHAEGLVILSGAAPSRQWRKPVQLMDVVRAAVAEVEDYKRIEVCRLPRVGVGGPAVADLTHLVAELLENATVFSPPHTAVQVHGERVANGFTVEIHDRGPGIAPDALFDANLRLAEAAEFELSDTDRLGLFVVSRLAERQNVRVSLQTSPFGGTTATVFIPVALLTDAPELGDSSPGGVFRNRAVAAVPREQRQVPDEGSERSGPVRSCGPVRLTRRHKPPTLVSGHGRRGGTPEPPQDKPGPAGHDGLPRRLRQTNLAPQLRAAPAPVAEPQATGGDGERDADQVRSRMASLQRGWQRGRRDNSAEESAPSPVAGTGPAASAPGPPSEGTGR